MDTDEPQTYLATTKLPSKTDNETTPTNSVVDNVNVVNRFHRIVRHHPWIQRLSITVIRLDSSQIPKIEFLT